MSAIRFLIAALFVASTCAQDYGMLFKYLNHRSTVSDLDLMRQSVETDVEEADNFLTAYSERYMNSTEWLWNVIVVEQSGLLRTVKLHNEFHYGKIKLFFEQIIETFDMASRSEIANAALRNVDHLPLKTQHSFWRAQLLHRIDKAMKDLVTAEWLPAAKTTVTSLLEDLSASDSPAEQLLDVLKAKFPFRAWLVFTVAAKADASSCIPENLLLLPPLQLPRVAAFVLHVDPRLEGRSEALGRIAESKTVSPFRCHRQSASIFAEMAESCPELRRSNVAAGVFAEAAGQEVHSSDQGRLQRRMVVRGFWKLCQQRYTAFTFQ